MRRRIRRAEDKAPLLKTLTENQRPFATMANALVFAAGLGHLEGRRIPLGKEAEAIPWEVFVNIGAQTFIDMLAGVVADETDILSDERQNDRLDIFEEYANGGLQIIQDRLAVNNRPPLQVLIDMALERESTTEPRTEIDLEAVAVEIIS